MTTTHDALRIDEPSTFNRVINYILTFVSIGQCGNGFLQLKNTYPIMAVILVSLIIIKGKHRIVNVLPWSIWIMFIYFIQVLAFGVSEAYGEFGWSSYIYMFLRHTIPMMYLIVIGKEYFKYYIRIMYLFSIIGLAIWAITWAIPPIDALLRSYAIRFSAATGSLVVEYKAISLFLIYTFTASGQYTLFPRNAGMFWEPGAYAVYLGIAMVVLFLATRKVKNDRHMLVFIAAMLTSQSTAGYITLFVFLMSVIILSKVRYKLALVIGFVSIAVGIYNFAPFMQEKVVVSYTQQTETDLSASTSGRFLAARKSLNSIREYPVFGRGISRRTEAGEFSAYQGAYGFIDLFAKYGLIAGLIYSIFFYKSMKIIASYRFRNQVVRYSLLMILSLLPVYFSQGVYISVVNLMIMQLSMLYKSLGQQDTVTTMNTSRKNRLLDKNPNAA